MLIIVVVLSFIIWIYVVDIVYVYKHGEHNGLELKYSLRSLKNIPHNNVYIFWDKPDWAKNIIHIPMKDEKWTKFKNVRAKYKAICLHKEISHSFILMNDDFYIIKPILEIPSYVRWPLKEVLQWLKESIWSKTRFFKAIYNVFRKFPKGNCYSLHIPMVMNKTKLLNIMRRFWNTLTCKRSLYWNYYNIPAKISPYWDCKVWGDNKIDIKEWQEFFSTNDDSIIRKDVLKVLNGFFPEKSEYEI